EAEDRSPKRTALDSLPSWGGKFTPSASALGASPGREGDRVRILLGLASTSRTQPSQRDHDEPANGRPGGHADGRCEGVKAIARQLAGRDIAPDLPGLHAFGQQRTDQIAEMLVRACHMRASMQQRREVGALVFVANERVGL